MQRVVGEICAVFFNGDPPHMSKQPPRRLRVFVNWIVRQHACELSGGSVRGAGLADAHSAADASICKAVHYDRVSFASY